MKSLSSLRRKVQLPHIIQRIKGVKKLATTYLPKIETYLVGTACDMSKPTNDLGSDVMCVLRDPDPAPVKRVKR